MTRRYILPTLLWLVLVYALVSLVERFPPTDRWWAFLTPDRVAALSWFAALFALATMMRALRFGVLVRSSVAVGWPAVLTTFPWLFMIGALTPFRLGEGLRAVWIRKYGGSSGEAIGFMVGERAIDFLILLLFGLLGLALAPTTGDLSATAPAAVLVVAIAGLVAATLMGPRLAELAGRVPLLARFGVPQLILAVGFLRHGGLGVIAMGLSIAIWLVMALAFLIPLNAMVGLTSVGGALLGVAAVNLIRILSPAPGNIGSYQAAMVAALFLYGVSAEDGLIAGVLLQVAMLTTMVAQGFLARLISLLAGLDAVK
ncbi:lysylphosphatidylglycerol synthase domain-containing protein [Microbaculum sp. FT89]|uniref:lysylphosphatidylglycerol synthase domain-containing protein n=1 Tax=Microbaculum sp. FT89 TaxID=3447298 RepID=UPI003F531B55